MVQNLVAHPESLAREWGDGGDPGAIVRALTRVGPDS